jgi:glycolate oxidase FAD binding subunit
MQEIIERFREQVRAASASGAALCLRGGGTKDWYGQAPQGAVLDTRHHSGVVDYEPTELVITARCGTPLAEIEDLLARHRQMLAFEPPRFGVGSTIGGVVAAGLSGPRRASAGAVRDFTLGAELMDGRGEMLRFGGQVMKNVAGYDVSRLLAGSLGTLGLITEVSLKVLPVPVREETIRFEMDEITALSRVNAWAGQPLPVSATCWRNGVLTVRLSGADAAVRAALQKLGGEQLASAAADAFWTALRDQTDGFFAPPGAAESGDAAGAAGGDLWRLSVPSAASAIILRGEQMIEWGGALRWLRTPSGAGTDLAASADAIRRTVAAAGGHATLYRRSAPGAGMQVFHPLAPAVARINERLKAGFDPSGIFNPGRMV